MSLGPLSSWHVSLASQGVEATVRYLDTYVMVARDKGIYISPSGRYTIYT